MSKRVSGKPIVLPQGVMVTLEPRLATVKGPKGELKQPLHVLVQVQLQDEQGQTQVYFAANGGSAEARAMAGTLRALLNNAVLGVSQGFEKKLQLVGVGYRVQLSGQTLKLSLGYSHPIDYVLPEGVQALVPANDQIVLKGMNKQVIGQVAADIRALRAPEPYKGKGVRYADEVVICKETKKKK